MKISTIFVKWPISNCNTGKKPCKLARFKVQISNGFLSTLILRKVLYVKIKLFLPLNHLHSYIRVTLIHRKIGHFRLAHLHILHEKYPLVQTAKTPLTHIRTHCHVFQYRSTSEKAFEFAAIFSV